MDAAGTQPDNLGQASSRQAGGLRSGCDQEEADGGHLEEGPPQGWGAPLSHGISGAWRRAAPGLGAPLSHGVSGAWRRGRPGDGVTAVPQHQ